MEEKDKKVVVEKALEAKTETDTTLENGEGLEATPEIISREKLLEAGVYFGHRAYQWNPKMKQYIYGKRLGIHIIDISKTQKALEYAYKILYKMCQKSAISFIWVGTKKHAKKAIEDAAMRTNSVYVNERWLGGTLTNSQTIFKSVKELERLEELQKTEYEGYSKKEGLLFDKKIAKLQKNLNGIRKLATKNSLPQVMICASPIDDEIAIKEAAKKGIKIFTINDTNSKPDLSDFVIPANDDSVKSITLILTVLADAICAAKGNPELFAYKKDEEIILPEDPKKDPNKKNFVKRPFMKKEADDAQTSLTETSTPATETKIVESKPVETKVEVVKEEKPVKETKKVTKTIKKEEAAEEVKVEKPKKTTKAKTEEKVEEVKETKKTTKKTTKEKATETKVKEEKATKAKTTKKATKKEEVKE
ncbi:30S ribosomal protein S2 [Metamycoplasma hyosynoviae]|nr:30S ribosomal protein S2 [Metamycoplasma hyosynoviae]MDC8911703.1 30S ribosomal protein S2 [Metamycoplasma hyosynoviae]MDC8920755.1 30S ribosomal protein S2 [Metamycoplasma hyosynoviae]